MRGQSLMNVTEDETLAAFFPLMALFKKVFMGRGWGGPVLGHMSSYPGSPGPLHCEAPSRLREIEKVEIPKGKLSYLCYKMGSHELLFSFSEVSC